MRFTVVDTTTGAEFTVAINSDETLIGSDPACDLVLNGPSIRGQHVRYIAKGHHRYLEVCEGATVEAFGRKVSAGECRRIDGKPFSVGQYTVRAHFTL
jgi:hypothetical protein